MTSREELVTDCEPANSVQERTALRAAAQRPNR